MGNKKNPGGQPPKYTSLKELQAKIDEYFETKVGKHLLLDEDNNAITDRNGKPVYDEMKPPTISGLARFLGFESRQSLYDYKQREEYSYAIKETTLRIEEFAEKQLFMGNCTGAIFWLKNKGWKDHTTIGGEDGAAIPIKHVIEYVDAKDGKPATSE